MRYVGYTALALWMLLPGTAPGDAAAQFMGDEGRRDSLQSPQRVGRVGD
ncbi:MAG TPA: hypothetical protein VHT95_09465 [Vicinamibacterales bacterium]|nr:hypothetical protein [Vicinamibacterales bacterium]